MAKAAQTENVTESLPERIAAAEQRIASLKDERATAVLAGQPFDNTALSAAEASLEALEDAQAAEQRQGQEAAQRAASADAARLCKEALEMEEKRRAAIEAAEASARSMVDAIKEAETCRAEIEARFKRLGISAAPGPNDQASRLSRALSAVLTLLTTRSMGTRWGDTKLHRGFVKPDDAWLKHEDDTTRRIKQTMETT